MKIGIVGGAGRMGRQLIKEVIEHPSLQLVGAIDHGTSAFLGQDLGVLAGKEPAGMALTADEAALFQNADAVIDFTAPAATMHFSGLAAENNTALVVGTTGLSKEQEDHLWKQAEIVPIVYAGNYSVGINLLQGLVEQASRILAADDFDIEIFEAHHKHKVDAPSGTALMLGRAAAKGRAVDLENAAVYTREGHTGVREDGKIGFSVARGGDIVGDHRVLFAGLGEQIELRHTATDRRIFARGALRAAQWARTQAPGLYSMQDVLGL